MASCVNTLKDNQPLYGAPPPASPRISFSNDFATQLKPPPRAVGTPDPSFEFAVGVRPMIAADELFFKGRMLPLSTGRVATLRAEGVPQPKGLVRWKEFLGLKRVNGGPSARKNDKPAHPSAKILSGSEKPVE